MAQYEIKEGWWWGQLPGWVSHKPIQVVRIGHDISKPTSWGYRLNEGDEPIPFSTFGENLSRILASPIHPVNSIEQLIDESRAFQGTSAGRKVAFFRGHRRMTWKLTPAVFRASCSGCERSMLNHFQSWAPVRCTNAPDENDLCGWLSLAQHYGLPTRLLDWTHSPLVAAYFAVEQHSEDDDHPGAIWVLSPNKLNELMGVGTGLLGLTTRNNTIKELVFSAFDDEYESPKKVIAVLPPERDVRLYVQQSAFTLHGIDTSLEDWRTELIPDEAKHRSLMQCAIILPESKPKIRDDLERLGIHEASLFPNLTNLSRFVARDSRNRKPATIP